MSEPLSPVLKAVSDAVLAVTSERSVEQVLQRLVDAARELAGARYAALGIPDGAGGFRRFLVSGMSEELIASLGPLPRTHGMLGAMLEGSAPYRTDDIHADRARRGGRPGPARSRARAGPRGAGGAACADPEPAPARAVARRARDHLAQAGRDAGAHARGSDRARRRGPPAHRRERRGGGA